MYNKLEYNQLERDNKLSKRLQWVDIARGIALFAMFIYHFTWDLGYFNYIARDTATTTGWVIFARLIAFSFLFLTGFSLFLAHQNHIRWKAFFSRLCIIVILAFAITLATYYAFPSAFIYFGILHEIALTSLLGLLFLRTPIILNAIVIVLIATLYVFMQNGMIDETGVLSVFQSPIYSWTGLNFYPSPSFDLVPFIPFFAAGLLGITTARILKYYNVLSWLKNGFKPLWLSRFMQFCGRHSLVIYVVHQPIFFLLVLIATYVVPPSYVYEDPSFEPACIASCQANSSLDVCQNFCSCTYDGLKQSDLLQKVSTGLLSMDDEKVQSILMQCTSGALNQ